MDLETSRTLGGVGAILIVVSGFGLIGGSGNLVGLVGLILFLIAMNGLANHYRERKIFNNALYGTIVMIMGIVGTITIIATTALTTLSKMGINLAEITDWRMIGHTFQASFQNFVNAGNLVPFIVAIILALVVLFAFSVAAVILFRKSLIILCSKTGVKMFCTAGLLMLIGAVLTIILVGFLIIWIAWILIAVAFFSIRTHPARKVAATKS